MSDLPINGTDYLIGAETVLSHAAGNIFSLEAIDLGTWGNDVGLIINMALDNIELTANPAVPEPGTFALLSDWYSWFSSNTKKNKLV